MKKEWGRKLTDISDQLLHLRISRNTNQQLKLAVCRVQPETADQYRQDDRAHGIDPPVQLTATDGGKQTKAVDEQVVAVVLPQDTDLRDVVAQRPAVQKQNEFGAESDGDGDDRR